MNNKSIVILRWIAALPAAVVAYFISNILCIGLFWFATQIKAESWLVNVASKPIAAGVAAYFFMLIGIYVAPNYKKIAALILMVIFLLIAGITMFPNIEQGNYENIITLIVEVSMVVAMFIKEKDPDNELAW